MWKTPYKHSEEEFFTEAGSPTRPLYKPVLGKDGAIELVEDGFENVYEQIQSFKDSVDINTIVARYAAGDVYALEQRVGSYGDFINVPASYMEVLNGAIELQKTYDANCAENEDFRKTYPTLDDFVSNFGKVNNNGTVPKIDIESKTEEVGEKNE